MSSENSAESVAAFRSTKDYQDIEFVNIRFTRPNDASDGDYGTALYLDNPVKLSVKGCIFEGLRSPLNGGSAIYVKTLTDTSNFDADTKFIGNRVDSGGCIPPVCTPAGWSTGEVCPDKCWGGGGALWIGSCFGSTVINIKADFVENVHEFAHGMGGALFIDYMQCKLNINGNYERNSASDGGAIHVEGVIADGVMNVDATFTDNLAPNELFDPSETQFGARGAAVRVRDVGEDSKVNIKGKYTGNKVEGRGAVSSFNHISGNVVLDVDARNNEAMRGAIASNWRTVTGKFIILADSVIKNNEATERPASQILDFPGVSLQLNGTQYDAATADGSNFVVSEDFISQA
ncbi:hypothetical protein SARC_03701 [Sphaeroforma arctica JP610]|uniref:Right handed beta helix domain-containing protein n=1 Tax=Sphaeroforma arctica JP610 TaxID=667725 RepID=A0A0L0G798_9EUKA|nr:hypothetical protein SARC_03701 [Sphaeroforma arctica JP610]KNC84073.1 hypothetical protein SARC_03701 [Sphaeroforma arctica JP610]|eukprot:XP_014157975.1 hypothetical protein SARC_03701 [Sphaeroforma arctica JP610]